MIDMHELVNKAISHQAVVESSRRDIRDNEIRISDEQRKLDNLIKENHTTKFSYEYLDKLVKDESGKFIKSLNDMLNYAVKVIFFDKDYAIDIRVSDNNKATIHLIYDDEDGNRVEPDIQVCGGGIRSVIGVLCEIFFIFKYKAEPIMLCDESFSMISTQYLDPLFSLLDELANKNDLKILLITHDVRIENLSTVKNHYKIENGRSIKEEVIRDASSTVAAEA